MSSFFIHNDNDDKANNVMRNTRTDDAFCFRSMAVQSHIPQSSFKHFEPQVKTTGATGGAAMKLDLSHIKPFERPCSKIVVSKPCLGWAMDKLRRLGYYHPLEPSHVSFPKTQLPDILTRLTDCFRALSCHVSYQDDLLAAACSTMEQVEFQVSFFESRQDAQTILCELQRRAGDSYVFHQGYAQPIMDVMHGKPPQASRRAKCCMSAGLSMDRLAKHAACISEDDVAVALELACKLVNNDRLDACRLGMESLETLTDTSKTGWSTASKVARELCMPSDETSTKLAQTMLRYLLEKSQAELCHLALQVWSNAWQVAADDMETPLDCFCDLACPADTLLNALMTRVEDVHAQPHEATLALQGLSALVREMPQLRASVSWPAVEEAYAVGSAENAALESAAHKCLDAR